MTILLHICCAPCAIGPVEELRREGHKVAGYFYNPNIHPYSEYERRKSEVERFARESGLPLMTGEWDAHTFFQHVVYNEAHGDRCPVCWWLRMLTTAKHARDNAFDAFTTTLLASPYQDGAILQRICADVAAKCGIRFCDTDFRDGFRASQAAARKRGMYMQTYCGCLFSEREAIEKRGARVKGQGSREKQKKKK